MKEYLKILKGPCFYFIIILYLEIVFAFIMHIPIKILNVSLFAAILSPLFSILSFHKRQTIPTCIILLILGILFSIQCVFYHVFKVYFSLANIGLSDQIKSFLKETLHFILNDGLNILVFLMPIPIYLGLRKKIDIPTNTLKSSFVYFGLLTLFSALFIFYINLQTGSNNEYELYYQINDVSLNIKKLGVLDSYYLDIKRTLFGFQGKVSNVHLDDTTTKKEYEKNILDLELTKEPYNDSIRIINNYISSDPGTYQNEYTGMWKDYNLIYITAESFSQIAISKELTPTLYKLTNTGFVFHNFYTPNILSTIGGEYQSLTGLYPDTSILREWRDGVNYYPYGLGTKFKELGYNTYAYHNNTFNFQDRDTYLRSQGFTNYQACFNGLENRINCNIWPQSDVEMIEVTSEDYIHSNKPFLAYYMTVSGHFEYSFDDNYMAYKKKDAVTSLEDLGEHAQAYVATQIELDRALETLLKKLEKANKLDKTIIVLQADHYPYELDIEDINRLSTYERDETFEINHNSLIIWNNQLEKKDIDKPCISIDVLPTVYNLFGIKYDSRLLIGKDILSTTPGIAIMLDHSWITDKGKYISYTGEFIPNEPVDDDYIRTINTVVNNRLNISRMIAETNYYNYLFH